MSSKKKKSNKLDPQDIHNEIIVALVGVKARLCETPFRNDGDITASLSKIIDLAEGLSRCKPLPAKIADDLDSEGVMLWNMITLKKPSGESNLDDGRLFAQTRLASYRLIEAGTEVTPTDETLIRVLQLATKTASSLISGDSLHQAALVLTTAAELEEKLKSIKGGEADLIAVRAGAIVSYWSSRMELSCKEGNESVAFQLMLTRAKDPRLLEHLPASDIQKLAAKLLDVGKAFIQSPSDESNRSNPSDSGAEHTIKWLQEALKLVDRLRDQEVLGLPELERGILRSLARAYYISSKDDPSRLLPAEETIKQLAATVGGSNDKSDEIHQLRWMAFTILKRKNTSDREIVDAFRAIVDSMVFEETAVTEILQEIGTLSDSRALAASVTQILLGRALDSKNNSGHPFVDRILISFLFQCTNSASDSAALEQLKAVLTVVSEHASYALEKLPTTACQSLLFQIGTRFFQSKQYLVAADWFEVCTHTAFKSTAETNSSKCFRKTALCHIEAGQYARAASIIRTCPGNEAATHYVSFLCMAYQGLEDEATQAINRMTAAPDFDRKMLLLATKLAHEKRMQSLILTILENLLRTLQEGAELETEVEAMTLIRCMVRVVAELLGQPLAPIQALVNKLLGYFSSALELIEAAIARKSVSLIVKDMAWLWRTAYNTAIQGCSTSWDEFQVAELFDSAQRLMQAFEKASVGDSAAEVPFPLLLASFSSICCRVFGTRRSGERDDTLTTRKTLVRDISAFRQEFDRRLPQIRNDTEKARLESFLNLSYVLEAEQVCRLKSWEDLSKAVQQATASNRNVGTEACEAIADILWLEPACPTDVLYEALEAILRSTLDRGHVDCTRFARWVRTICSILVSRGRTSDRVKALDYVEQAIEAMKDNDEYPVDEQQWLLATSYNTGVDSLQTSRLDEGKRWFECAARIAREIPGGQEDSRKVEDAYRELLARFKGTTKPAAGDV